VKIAYLDTFSGISGDMTVGALLDLGLPLDALRKAIAILPLSDVTVETERVFRSGIAATKFRVRVAGQDTGVVPDPLGHDHEHAHSHPDGVHTHRQDATAAHGERHAHRPYVEIRALLAGSALVAPVKERALAIFQRLAEAEAQVHGVAPESVSFHEVGALDAIVDVVGAALGFTYLGVDAIHAAALPLGRGLVQAAHGPLPVPAPAVLELLRDRSTRLEDGASELVTPTGAAIIAALADRAPVPTMKILATGYGAGDRVLADRPNLLRIVLGESVVAATSDEVTVIEANIDDMSPQLYEHVLERLFAAGARDAYLVPIVMKKSRPGTTLCVLAAPTDRARLAGIIFAETSTIGLRYSTWQRTVLPRETRTVETVYGAVRVKLATAPDGTLNVAPEYEDCRRLATERGVPLKLVHQAALLAALK